MLTVQAHDANPPAADYLFVYGTLRAGSGHAQQQALAQRAAHIGAAWVAGQLLCLGDYPGLIPGPGRVRGDLYQLPASQDVLLALDAYEEVRGEADDLYRRYLTWVEQASGLRVWAWVYWYAQPVKQQPRLASGDWLQHCAQATAKVMAAGIKKP